MNKILIETKISILIRLGAIAATWRGKMTA